MNEDFIALDVETAIGKRWSICQIGITIVEKGKIVKTITELVQPPQNEYAPMNIRIHGITPDMTQGKSFFPEVWEKIYPLIESKKIVAHNAAFDIDCLKQSLHFYNMHIPDFDFDCTLNLTGRRLKDACWYYGVCLDNHHDAGCDAEACAWLYIKVKSGEFPDPSLGKPPKQTNIGYQVSGHDRLQGDVLKPNLESADPDSPFYNKKVVFTGVLKNIKRGDAAEAVKNMGADVDTGITKRTNYVVTGSEPGPSKMNKIFKYNNEGCDIKILYENDFLGMIKK